MPKIKVVGQTVQTGERTQTNGQTDKRTDGRYQFYYLPRFAVDNYPHYTNFTNQYIVYVLRKFYKVKWVLHVKRKTKIMQLIINNVKNKFLNISCTNWGSLLTRLTSSYGVSDFPFRLLQNLKWNSPDKKNSRTNLFLTLSVFIHRLSITSHKRMLSIV